LNPPPPDSWAAAATILRRLFLSEPAARCFNLLPIPPLDGFGVLGLFTDSEGALRLQQLRMKMRGAWMLVGILIASRLVSYVYEPLLEKGIRLIYAFLHVPPFTALDSRSKPPCPEFPSS